MHCKEKLHADCVYGGPRNRLQIRNFNPSDIPKFYPYLCRIYRFIWVAESLFVKFRPGCQIYISRAFENVRKKIRISLWKNMF